MGRAGTNLYLGAGIAGGRSWGERTPWKDGGGSLPAGCPGVSSLQLDLSSTGSRSCFPRCVWNHLLVTGLSVPGTLLSIPWEPGPAPPRPVLPSGPCVHSARAARAQARRSRAPPFTARKLEGGSNLVLCPAARSLDTLLLFYRGGGGGCLVSCGTPERQSLLAMEIPLPHVYLFETLCPQLIGCLFLSLSRAVWAFNGLEGTPSTFPRLLGGGAAEDAFKHPRHTQGVWGFTRAKSGCLRGSGGCIPETGRSSLSAKATRLH